jgi:hypothetical protein
MLNVISGTLSAGAPPVSPTSYESIATVTVGSGGSSSISFTSIPSTYKHLQIRAIGRSTTTVADSTYRFNSDSGSNYAFHLLVGNGTAAQAFSSTSQTFLKASPYIDTNSNTFGAGVTDILDYADTNKYKTVRTLTGMENNNAGNAQIQFFSGLWQSTTAITSITITPSSSNYAEYSSFALYGIKG